MAGLRPASVATATPQRLATLGAIAEALLPSLPDLAAKAREAGNLAQAAMYEYRGDQDPQRLREVLQVIDERFTPENRAALVLLLDALAWRLGTLALAGSYCLTAAWPFIHPFVALPVASRERVLQGWATSPIPDLRKAFKGLKSIILSVLFSSPDAGGSNVFWEGMQYPGATPPRPLPAAAAAEAKLEAGVIDLAAMVQPAAADVIPALQAKGCRVAQAAEAVNGEDAEVVVECDVVVVGSGAGGGVAAAVLAQAGQRVLVVEKGPFKRDTDLTLQERESFTTMYENGGVLATEDGAVSILAGATLGGGTRVNWCASFRTPDHVRREWAHQHGLPAFMSEQYTRAMDAVCQRLGVHDSGVVDDGQNAALRRGLQALGVQCGTIPQNCAGPCTGFCCFGCVAGGKQDVNSTFLADAVAAGARVVTGVFAERILITPCTSPPQPPPDTGSLHQRPWQAQGVLAAVGAAETAGATVRLRLTCKCVVVAAGALHTPALLLRSGFTVNGNVGRNLRLHPATFVAAVFPEEKQVRMWEGPMMTAFSKAEADWDGSGYGPLLSIPQAHPGIFAAACPWLGGAHFKQLMARFPSIAIALIYTRDKGSGQVTVDAQGRPRITYWPSNFDQASSIRGSQLAVRALAAAGAGMVAAIRSGPSPVLELGGADDKEAAISAYCAALQKQGMRVNDTVVMSAHQMGSCRMGTSPQRSVVDEAGECWDVQNLYLADASVLPTSSGVNPMITVESTAYMIAQGLAEHLKKHTRTHLTVADSYD